MALFFPTGHRMEVYWEHCRRAGASQEKDWFSLHSASTVHDMHLQLQRQQPKHFKPQRGGGARPNLLNASWSDKERVLLRWIAFCDDEAVQASSLAGDQVQPDYTFASRPGKVEMPVGTRVCKFFEWLYNKLQSGAADSTGLHPRFMVVAKSLLQWMIAQQFHGCSLHMQRTYATVSKEDVRAWEKWKSRAVQLRIDRNKPHACIVTNSIRISHSMDELLAIRNVTVDMFKNKHPGNLAATHAIALLQLNLGKRAVAATSCTLGSVVERELVGTEKHGLTGQTDNLVVHGLVFDKLLDKGGGSCGLMHDLQVGSLAYHLLILIGTCLQGASI